MFYLGCLWGVGPRVGKRGFFVFGVWGGVGARWFELLLGVMEREGMDVRAAPEVDVGAVEKVVGW